MNQGQHTIHPPHFYPRSPCGERHPSKLAKTSRTEFLSTLSLRRATIQVSPKYNPPADFYPRSPCGERPWAVFFNCNYPLISIHALLAESDHFDTLSALAPEEFLSTLSLRRATHYDNYNLHCVEISIHALLAESDTQDPQTYHQCQFLSTLSLRRATFNQLTRPTRKLVFLSTLSLRRATRLWYFARVCCYDFYPRSPCGERPTVHQSGGQNGYISIHALLAESDMDTLILADTMLFLSTLSLRRATFSAGRESDTEENFYPRSPCGERPPRGGFCYLDNIISIHALLAESDHKTHRSASSLPSFLSTLSLRRATVQWAE